MTAEQHAEDPNLMPGDGKPPWRAIVIVVVLFALFTALCYANGCPTGA